MIRLAITGVGGRLGRELVAAARADPEVAVIAGLVRPGSPLLGADIGRLASGEPLGVPATDDVAAAVTAADALVDFSRADATVGLARAAAIAGRPFLSGVTGLSDEQRRVLEREIAATIPVLLSANTSPGVNALLRWLPELVRALGSGYDVEIVETHHRHKRDAPSGTALALAHRLASATGSLAADRIVAGRAGEGVRQAGEIGVHARRAGGAPGEHRILLASDGDAIEISHIAFSRRTYADGALRAAKWLVRQPPGWYMGEDVS